MTPDQINYWNLQELKRSNRVKEAQNQAANAEINRHNLVTENLSYQSQIEIGRHNLATEANDARQTNEMIRSNLANESIGRAQIGLGYAQLAETKRNNIAMLNEQHRFNNATISNQNLKLMNDYSLAVNQQHEIKRHNLISEQQQQQSLSNQNLRITNDYSLAVNQQSETKRHNLITERQQQFSNAFGTLGSYGSLSSLLGGK